MCALLPLVGESARRCKKNEKKELMRGEKIEKEEKKRRSDGELPLLINDVRCPTGRMSL